MSPWHALTITAPIDLPPPLYRALASSYATPPRAYHSLDHVIEVVEHWRDVAVRLGWRRPCEGFLALLYHDAVYVAGRGDNEAMSAAFARAHVGGLPGVDIAEVERLIMLTASHGRTLPAEVDGETALLLDCDLAILGAPADRFAEYDRAIAIEYGHLPREDYRVGRRRFLERLLARPRIFLSDDFHARFDAPARRNLAWALTAG